MSEKQRSCKERVRANYRSRIGDIRKLWNLYREDCEATTEDGENWNEYGLCFDYVPRGTFNDQKRGYWRYQISTGGPGDEFRFFCDEDYQLTKIEYWFLDWYDGAKVSVTGKARELLDEIWSDWLDCDIPQHAKKEASK